MTVVYWPNRTPKNVLMVWSKINVKLKMYRVRLKRKVNAKKKTIFLVNTFLAYLKKISVLNYIKIPVCFLLTIDDIFTCDSNADCSITANKTKRVSARLHCTYNYLHQALVTNADWRLRVQTLLENYKTN